MHTTDISWENYPHLHKYSAPLKPMTRRLIGRDSLIRSIMAAFSRAELCNVILLAPAGAGKTSLVQGTMERDADRLYLEVDLARMIADCQNDTNEMAAKLKMLFSETEQCVDNEGQEIVLFIDEFHQVVQLSAAAVEALKPLLADSGTRGIRVIAATTLEEFNQFISPNQPLVERLQRINVPEPDEEATVEILKNMAKTYGVDNLFFDDHVFHMIYEYTNRYIPANSQPRKSIKVLDAMVGWHRSENRKMDDRLLADVIQESEDVNVAFRVDASTIKKRLDEKVLAQQYATSQIERRLQLCVADLNDKSKPMSTFLFTGSTGVGKTEMTKQLAEILFQDQRRLLRFDMTEYANDESLERFRDLLTTRIWEHPYSIVLLDEIEKACSSVTRLLLQVLDDGRLTNRNNREVSFTNCYIVLTTNAGSEIYKTIAQYGESNSEKDMAIIAKKYDKLIRRSLSETSGDNRFPPELIGRIDVMVPFQPLSRETMGNIVMMKLRKLKAQVKARHGVQLVIDKDVVRYLVEDNLSTDSDSGGARIVMSKLETEVTTNVARYINEHPFASRIAVKVDGDMAIDNKRQLESLIRSGALDSFGVTRSSLAAEYEHMLDELSHRASDGVEGQIGLFDAAEDTAIKDYEFPDLAELPIEQRLAQEKESTGFYFSGHPLDRYRADIQARGALTVSALRSLALDGEGGENVERSEYTIGGMVSSVSEKRTKKGDMMAFVTLEDESLPIELIVFPRVYEQCRPYLTAGSPIAVRGRPQLGDDDEKRTVSLIASAIEPLRAGAVTSSGASGAAVSGMRAANGRREASASGTPTMSGHADAAAGRNSPSAQPHLSNTSPNTSDTLRYPQAAEKIKLFVRVPDMKCESCKRAENLFSIFELEHGAPGARVMFYDSSNGEYRPRSGGDVALSTVMLGELRTLLGEENVALRRDR